MNESAPARVRAPAVAGLFYPGEAGALARSVAGLLADAPARAIRPRALVVPHAGYRFSGAVAAKAYALLADRRDAIRRVVLLGPSHRVALSGMAVPGVTCFETPLGRVPVDQVGVNALVRDPAVTRDDAPHAQDHALEVQLPFLQSVLESFEVVPVAVGRTPSCDVARVIDLLWGDEATLFVVSTDLSHFHHYQDAERRDAATARAIVERRGELTGEQACGCYALNGLLSVAAERDLRVELLERCNSGDTGAGRDRVVGYASFAVA